jgi:hypothetical protein
VENMNAVKLKLQNDKLYEKTGRHSWKIPLIYQLNHNNPQQLPVELFNVAS